MGVDDAKRRRLFLQIGQHAYQNDVLDDIGKAAGVKGVSVIHGRGWPIRADVMSSTRLLRVMAGLVPPRERSGGPWPKPLERKLWRRRVPRGPGHPRAMQTTGRTWMAGSADKREAS